MPKVIILNWLLTELGINKARPNDKTEPLPLGFTIHNEYPEKVLEADRARFVAIGRKGVNMLYSMLCLNMSQHDVGVMEDIKGKVVGRLLARQSSIIDAKEVEQLCIAELQGKPTGEERGLLAMLLVSDISGYGPISVLMRDPNIEEIEINSPTARISVFHANYGRCITNLSFRSEPDFRSAINRLMAESDKELNSLNPVIDAQLGDGARINAQLRPYAVSGAVATIRLQSRKKCDIRKLLENGTLSAQATAYLWMAIEAQCNFVISGSPASGKTTLLMALHAFVPPYERTVTIEEEVNELTMHRNFMNVVPLQGSKKHGSVSVSDQVKNALRMRPDRLIIGEIRGSEAKEAFSGANLGVPFITTMHSSGNGDAIIGRLKSKPMSVEDYNISMLDLSLFMAKPASGERKLSSIVEYRWMSRLETGMPQSEGLNVPAEKEMITVLENGSMNRNLLKDSKIIKRWSSLNMTTEAKALTELRNRERHIMKLLDKDGVIADTSQHISEYYLSR
jgi:flagellar protein FlaI